MTAKTTKKSGKRAMMAGRGRPKARKPGAPKGPGTRSRKPKPAKLTPRKQKLPPASATVSLREQLKTARLQQEATAEILRAVAHASGDAAGPLQLIAKTTARLFGASSVRIRLVKDGEWGSTFHVGRSSDAVRAAVPDAKARVGGRNLPGTVVAENRQIHIPDLDHIPSEMADWPGLPPARAAGARVISGTPLRRGGEAIGVLIIHRDRLAPFAPEELALQQSFADQAVIAIENARLFNETQEALARQTASAEILRVISGSQTDVQPVFDAIVRTAVRLLNCDRAFFMRVDGRTYTPVSAVGRDGPIPLGPNRPIDPAANFPSRAIATKQMLHQPDWSKIELPEFERGIHERFGINSALYLPLLREDDCIGLLVLVGSRPNMFSETGISLAESFRDQAVIAIENARLFDETKEALSYQTGSSNVLRVIASSPANVAPVLEAIVQSARELCEAGDAIVLLKDGDHLRFNAHSGPIPVTVDKWPIGPGWTAGLAFLDQKPVHVHDMLSEEGAKFPDARAMGQSTGAAIRTVLSVPLLREKESIGAILLRRTELRPFSQKQIDLLSTFADQAVIAIQNANLFNETKEALEQQTATADILAAINGSAGDPAPVFECILEKAHQLCGAPCGSLQLYQDGRVVPVAIRGMTPAFTEFLRRGYPITEGVRDMLLAVHPVQRADVSELVREKPDEPSLRAASELGGIGTMASVPLVKDGVAFGRIIAARQEVRPFDDKQIATLQGFAAQAVIAIENARLLQQLRARTDDLSEALQQQTATADVLKVISRSVYDLQTVLDTLVESAYKLCGANLGLLYLRGDDAFECKAIAGIGVSEASRLFKGRPIRAGRGTAAERVILTGKVQSITDFYADPEMDPRIREAIRNAGGSDSSIGKIRSTLAVPMTRDDAVIGVMVIGCARTGAYPQRQVELLQTFADQAVIAIENARLFDEVQARTRELSLSLEELRTAQDRLVQTEKLASLGQLTAGIAHEIKNPLNFVNNFSSLSGDLIDELNDALKEVPLDDKARTEIGELTRILKGNLEKVVQHGRRADSIVKNMLLHSREGSGERRSADINAIVEESLNLAYHGARAEKSGFNITLQRDLDPSAGMIDLYPQEITRVLLNLISNGFYAANKHSEIRERGFEPSLTAITKDLGNKVEIRIRDNGTGIPADVREKMFNPFFTTKPAGEGTGLGLSMSHDIVVKQHGGRIEVATEPGQFTEFIITLPRVAAAKTQAGVRN